MALLNFLYCEIEASRCDREKALYEIRLGVRYEDPDNAARPLIELKAGKDVWPRSDQFGKTYCRLDGFIATIEFSALLSRKRDAVCA